MDLIQFVQQNKKAPSSAMSVPALFELVFGRRDTENLSIRETEMIQLLGKAFSAMETTVDTLRAANNRLNKKIDLLSQISLPLLSKIKEPSLSGAKSNDNIDQPIPF
jgi:hypothetical protein